MSGQGEAERKSGGPQPPLSFNTGYGPGRGGALDVALRVLDQQIVDWEGRRCGRVDDVEFDVSPGRPPTLAALLVGPDHLAARMPPLLRRLARLTRHLGDAPDVRVPWSEVDEVTHVVKLKRRAQDVGLGGGEAAALRLVRRLTRT
jgi:sporulation protein YlmC with PRC-barrel domain